MPSKTQVYLKFPWDGGLNSSRDPGVINDNDLVTADNVILGTTGARTKREGLDEFGSTLPALSTRSSSGTTRTLVFASAVEGGAPDNDLLVVGEPIKVSGPDTGDESNYVGISIIDTVSGSTITYTLAGTFAEGSTAVTDLTIKRNYSILNLTDYWRFNTSFEKQQVLLAATNTFKLFQYDPSGNRTEIDAGTSAEPTEDIRIINSLVMSNTAVMAFDEKLNLPIKFRPEDSADYELLGGSPPDFSLMTEYLGRMWTNDKSEPDRVHYSATGNIEQWNGTSDSGAIDVSLGDGDSLGITGIYNYKGMLFVAKGGRLWRILGDTPATFSIEPVSNGIGMEAHASAVTIDQDDVLFVSKRGFHSTIATAAFGDTQTAFISKNIQPTFNDFDQTILDKIQGVYVPELNSAAFAIAENETDNNSIFFYHTELKAWYRWPNVSCEALTTRLVQNSTKLTLGTVDGRVLQAQNGTFSDFDVDPIQYRVKTGTIYPGGNPQSIKAFKRIGFMYKPISDNFTVQVKIDNFPIQSFIFSQIIGGDDLGTDFLLGTSILGNQDVLAPFMFTMDGYGRGMTITITQNSAAQQVEIYGYVIEFEEIEGVTQEVV